MKPTVSRWVAARAPGVHREVKTTGPLDHQQQAGQHGEQRRRQEKAQGAEKGGAFSKESTVYLARAWRTPPQRVIRISNVPSGNSSVS